MSDFVVTNEERAKTVLGSSDFRPPDAPMALPGRIGDLRAAMARFSAADTHRGRRIAVEDGIAELASSAFAADAMARASERLSGQPIDAVADLGFIVPTECLAAALGVAASDLDDVRRDTGQVVHVIGRQNEPTRSTDEAVARLHDRFADHAGGPVVPISLLYQNHDATAALLASSVLANHLRSERRSALAATARVASRATCIGGLDYPSGAVVRIDLEAAGLEFGWGSHECPGQAIAEQIVVGINEAIDQHGYRLIGDRIEYDQAGRPTALPMEPSAGASR